MPDTLCPPYVRLSRPAFKESWATNNPKNILPFIPGPAMVAISAKLIINISIQDQADVFESTSTDIIQSSYPKFKCLAPFPNCKCLKIDWFLNMVVKTFRKRKINDPKK